MEKIRCQSCGMPLPENYPSEYCQFCFQNGNFTEPELTLDGMIKKSVDYMTTNLNFSKENAQKLSNEIIPSLKRWKS